MPCVCRARELRQLDDMAGRECQIPAIVLMETAGRAVAKRCMELLPHNKKDGGKQGCCPIIVMCGGGNNGGDGFVAARVLYDYGYMVHILLFAEIASLKAEARLSYDMLRFSCSQVTMEMVPDNPDDSWLALRLGTADLIVDGIIGVGLSRPLQGKIAKAVSFCNDVAHCPIVAIDVPTGVDSDSGEIKGEALVATDTVTFSCLKSAHLLEPAASCCGKITLENIGIPKELIERINVEGRALNKQEAAKLLPARPRTSHKGTYGHAVLVGGSIGKIGALTLGALGALRSGVGLCTVISSSAALAGQQQLPPEVMTFPYREVKELSEVITSLLNKQGAVAFGPGWDSGNDERHFLTLFLGELDRPIVLDAAALRLLADYPKLVPTGKRDLVITPHPGEMSAIMRRPVPEIVSDPLNAALAVATKHKITVVLKGAPTVIASPEGKWTINTTGNNGLATGGSGDLLTGIIVSLLAQGLKGYDAACLGCYLHGLAADLAISNQSCTSLLPSDVAAALGMAIHEIQSQS